MHSYWELTIMTFAKSLNPEVCEINTVTTARFSAFFLVYLRRFNLLIILCSRRVLCYLLIWLSFRPVYKFLGRGTLYICIERCSLHVMKLIQHFKEGKKKLLQVIWYLMMSENSYTIKQEKKPFKNLGFLLFPFNFTHISAKLKETKLSYLYNFGFKELIEIHDMEVNMNGKVIMK